MILTSQERQALLALAALLLLGQVAALWSEHRRQAPDRELSAWLNAPAAGDSLRELQGGEVDGGERGAAPEHAGGDAGSGEAGGPAPLPAIGDGPREAAKEMSLFGVPGAGLLAGRRDGTAVRPENAGRERGRRAPAAAVVVEPESAVPPGVRQGARVRINAATAEDLELLPGIGPALARRIVDERNRGGPYRGIEDLRRVKGIGPKSLDRLRDWIDCAPP